MDLILTLDRNCLIEVMDCVAGADDTTKLQETGIRDQLAISRSELSRKNSKDCLRVRSTGRY
jgi:hypothetical protein